MELVLGIILLVAAVFLVVAVLLQEGKSNNLSGTIAGGSETFLGKSKSRTLDKKLSRLTTVVAIVFVVIVVGVYVTQNETDYDALFQEYLESLAADTDAEDVSDSDTAEDTSDTDAPDDTDAANDTSEDTDAAE